MSYPKVLIIGQQFDKRSGGGITLTNLFYGWDINKIAVVASEISNPDFSVCNKFYCMGASEIERDFPFNLKLSEKESDSGIIECNNHQHQQPNFTYKPQENRLVLLKDSLLYLTGQIHRRRKFVISEKLLNWINEFAPDIIYSQLSTFELIRLVDKLHSELKKPLVFHMMDDWPTIITCEQKGIFKLYWNHRINTGLKRLLSKANVLLSISESMSEAYLSRYNRTFIPFHNPITKEDWLPYSKKDWSINNVFKLIYTGRIGTATNKSILFISKTIDRLNQSGLRIKLDIYSSNYSSQMATKFHVFKGVEVKNAVPHNSIPSLLYNYDLLLLPLDFDKVGIDFARYSMPTKASEYMISGIPTLVFADMQTALAKHAIKYKWAYVVSENSTDQLETALNKLATDKDLRSELGYNAKEFAIKHYDSKIVREEFKNSLQKAHLSCNF